MKRKGVQQVVTTGLSSKSITMVEAANKWPEEFKSMFHERVAIVMEGAKLDEDAAIVVAFESTRKMKDRQ